MATTNDLWGLDEPEPVDPGAPGIGGRLAELVRYLRGDGPGVLDQMTAQRQLLRQKLAGGMTYAETMRDPELTNLGLGIASNFAGASMPMATRGMTLPQMWPLREAPVPGLTKGPEMANPVTQASQEAYKARAGIAKPPLEGKLPMPEDYLRRVADHMDEAPHAPTDPDVAASYRAMIGETGKQFEALKEAGVRFVPFTGKGEPYASSAQMAEDVAKNKRLYFLKTENAYGSGQNPSNNPMLGATKYHDLEGNPMVANDLFRVIHDYYGHTPHGFRFGGPGEYNAFHEHARMFSDEAVPALASETLGQNAWVNFGRHLRRADGSIPKPSDPDYVPLTERPFSDQKMVKMPWDLLNADPARGIGLGR
jgi:hypothetical protein